MTLPVPTPSSCAACSGGAVLNQYVAGMGHQLASVFASYLQAGPVGWLALGIAAWIVTRVGGLIVRVLLRPARRW